MRIKLYLVLLISPVLISACSDDIAVPHGSGLIEATEVTVSSQTTGQLLRLEVDEGDRVGMNDTLLVIDTTHIALQLKQAQAHRRAAETKVETAELQVEKAELDYELAAKEYERAERLIKTGSIGRQQYDQIETAYNLARLARKSAKAGLEATQAELARIEAEISMLEEQYSDCFPVAPVTGTVVTTFLETGEFAATGKPLVKIDQLDTVWVKLYVPSRDLTRIKLGDTAEIDPEDDRAEPLSGKVTWISPEAEFTPKNIQTKEARADLVYAVKITIPNPNRILKVGMPVAIRVPQN